MNLIKKDNNENKKEKFRRIATKRTNDIIDKIRLLGNCSNKISYEYTEIEVNKIFLEIESYLKNVRVKFKIDKNERFKL